MKTDWTAKARHALETEQPELARLYMRRGLSETPDGRRWLAQQRQLQALQELGRAHLDFAAAVSAAFTRTAEALLPLLAALTEAQNQTQNDFALAGPTEGNQ